MSCTTALLLQVCTLNVLFEGHYQRHCDDTTVPLAVRTAQFGEWLPSALAGCDVLLLQEFPYSGIQGADWTRLVEHHTAHSHSLHTDSTATAEGLLTMVRSSLSVLSHSCRTFPGKKKAICTTTIAKDNTNVTVVNTHIPWEESFSLGLANLREAFNGVGGDYVVAGDWNLEVQGGGVDEFEGFLQGVGGVDVGRHHASQTCTGTAETGWQRLDYIVADTGARTVEVSVHPTALETAVHHYAARERSSVAGPTVSTWFSDHAFVSATLQWGDPKCSNAG